jgi:hypothetical protein
MIFFFISLKTKNNVISLFVVDDLFLLSTFVILVQHAFHVFFFKKKIFNAIKLSFALSSYN